jgi:glycosyltransferase involved in cell wall biosynthesis
MKVVICWSQLAGYTTACWRELAAQPGVKLHVLYFQPDHAGNTRFSPTLVEGLSNTPLSLAQQQDSTYVESVVAAEKPDVVVVCGWFARAYRNLPFASSLKSARFIMAMDTPYRGDFRQRVAPWILRRYLRRFEAVVVASELAKMYAEKLGVAPYHIHRMMYAYDDRLFNRSTFEARLRNNGGWPRRFLFIGRYVHNKAVDVLVAAYSRYREQATSPWDLGCCGMGPLCVLMQGVDGIYDYGFVQPSEQPALFEKHGVFVLPSRYEPWGVVVAEAMATGMPVICSSAAGASGPLIHPYFNGLDVAPGNPNALAEAMLWMHRHHDLLPEMGRCSSVIAPAYSSKIWAVGWKEMLESLAMGRCTY